jgi:O-antigen/teichoic acid export membrane protein
MSVVRQGWRTFSVDIVVYGVAFAGTNAISYLYLVIAGRTLAAADFGVFNALLGLITLCGFLASSVQFAVTQATARKPDHSALAAFLRIVLQFALPGIALLVLAGIPFAAAIGADTAEVVVCGLVVLLMFLCSTALGFLAGIGRIRDQALINLLGAIARLALGWLLLLVGAGTEGAILGYLLNYAVVLVLAWWVGSRAIALSPAGASAVPELRLDLTAMATFVLAFAPFSLDQLLVQALAPSLGGNYAALATTAKLVFFAALPVIAVTYPYMLRQSAARHRARLLLGAMAGVVGIAGSLAWMLATFPQLALAMLFGGRFPQAAAQVGALAFGVACFSVSALGAHALVVWGSRVGFLPSLVGVGAGMILFAVRHGTLADIVANQMWTYGLQLILMLALLGLRVRHSLKSPNPMSLERVAT